LLAASCAAGLAGGTFLIVRAACRGCQGRRLAGHAPRATQLKADARPAERMTYLSRSPLRGPMCPAGPGF